MDILVNNAGGTLLGTALHTTIEEWDQMVSLNVSALLHVTHAAVPHLIDAAATSPRQVADTVNIKFGLNGFTEALRKELILERVRVAEPGTVQTELVHHLGEATRTAALQQVSGTEPLQAADSTDAIGCLVTRERRVAVNEMLVRAGDQTW
ncbi:SDR family NAD(P)-dependent oxidoreductase [Streptomyces sp. NPDC001351]|uniref:SDR family NAD(P)-dependent oxidoreductase n=1 Tax=Streptomyces sp. NPDC001351 TaxID=3364564 RepID=UPI0036B5EA0D